MRVEEMENEARVAGAAVIRRSRRSTAGRSPVRFVPGGDLKQPKATAGPLRPQPFLQPTGSSPELSDVVEASTVPMIHRDGLTPGAIIYEIGTAAFFAACAYAQVSEPHCYFAYRV